jgi:hypothetical protein
MNKYINNFLKSSRENHLEDPMGIDEEGEEQKNP